MKEGENFSKTEEPKSLEERLLDIEIEGSKEFRYGMIVIFILTFIFIYFISKGYLQSEIHRYTAVTDVIPIGNGDGTTIIGIS